jgi:hypothetical protein
MQQTNSLYFTHYLIAGRTGYAAGMLEITREESEATALREKLSLCRFDVYISMTYNEREKGEKSR